MVVGGRWHLVKGNEKIVGAHKWFYHLWQFSNPQNAPEQPEYVLRWSDCYARRRFKNIFVFFLIDLFCKTISIASRSSSLNTVYNYYLSVLTVLVWLAPRTAALQANQKRFVIVIITPSGVHSGTMTQLPSNLFERVANYLKFWSDVGNGLSMTSHCDDKESIAILKVGSR